MSGRNARYNDAHAVSMESGLEDRNNPGPATRHRTHYPCLNGVRPRRPEQLGLCSDRRRPRPGGLNGVRPRRPEQYCTHGCRCAAAYVSMESGLEDRNNPRRSHSTGGVRGVSMESGLEDRNNRRSARAQAGAVQRLNGVRPRRPEQYAGYGPTMSGYAVSMESGLEDRNNDEAEEE